MNMNPRALQLLGGATAIECGALLCGAVRGQLDDEGPVFRCRAWPGLAPR